MKRQINLNSFISIILILHLKYSRGTAALSLQIGFAAFLGRYYKMPKHVIATNDNRPSKKQASLAGFFSSKTKLNSSNSTQEQLAEQPSQYKIYCDLDGVLVDFDAGVRGLFNNRPNVKCADDVSSRELWSTISRATNFYSHLPWTPDGQELWNAILPLKPDILTGVPMHRVSRAQKVAWCRRELTLSNSNLIINHVDMAAPKKSHQIIAGTRRNSSNVVDVITCWSANKHEECILHPHLKCVLIDDRDKLAAKWRSAGGIFVHHTSTEATLQQLSRLGILVEASELKA